MAKSKNIITAGLRGGVGGQLVFKQYEGCTVVTKYPDMSGVKPSGLQKACRSKFLEAVKYAKGILADEVLRAAFEEKIGKGKSVYHAAIREYMKG